MAKEKAILRDLPTSILSVAPSSAHIIEQLCPNLSAEISVLSEQMEAVARGGGVIRLARAFVALHRIKTLLDAINGESGGKYPGLFAQYKTEIVPKAFEDDGVNKSLPLAEGYRLTVSGKVRATVRADVKEKAHEWLRNNNLGAIIIETVPWQTLTATATELMENEGKELPEDLFSVQNVMNTSVTSTK